MIIVNTANHVPKKFATYATALDSVNRDIADALYNLLGTGVVNIDKITSNDFEVVQTYNPTTETYSLTFKYKGNPDLTLSFASDSGQAFLSRVRKNTPYSYSLPFDEVNSVSGDVLNQFKFPLAVLAPDSIAGGYSSDYFSAIYVNGTPQKGNFLAEPDPTSKELLVGFVDKIIGGAYHPRPFDLNNAFSSLPVSGGTLSSWYDNFTTQDAQSNVYLHLNFDNINLAATPRQLVAQLRRGSVVEYCLIPKDIADPDTRLFYSLDDSDSTKITVRLTDTYIGDLFAAAPDTVATFYLVTPLEELNPFSKNTSFSRKYKLPYRNIFQSLGNVGNIKLLAIDAVSNRITDLTSLDSNVVGNIYSVDYLTGTLEVFNLFLGVLDENTRLYLANIEYAPPVQLDYQGDAANVVTIYGETGTAYVKSEVPADGSEPLPASLNVYAYLQSNPRNFSFILDSQAQVRTVYQMSEVQPQFVITTDNLSGLSGYGNTKYLNLGTLSKSGGPQPANTSYSFVLNPSLVTPYEALKSLAQEIQLPPLYRVFGLNLPVVSAPQDGGLVKKILPVAFFPAPVSQVLLHGYVGQIVARYLGPEDYKASLVLVDMDQNTETEVVSITTDSNGTIYWEQVASDLGEPEPSTIPGGSISLSGAGTRRYLGLKLESVNSQLPRVDFEVYMTFYMTLV